MTKSEPTKLVIEPSYPIVPSGLVGQIIVIGCGGTGGYVVRDLARSLSTLGRKVELMLIDGDKVEAKNLKRQNFLSPDIGKNKAEVLAGRYTSLGIQIAFAPKYLSNVDELRTILSRKMETGCNSRLIISCVDNVKTRKLIRSAYLDTSNLSDHYWIDLGNDEHTGQAVLAVHPYDWSYSDGPKMGIYPVPDVFDLYPEFLTREDKLPTEMSCAELAESSPQYGFINAIAASVAVNWAHELLVGGAIKTHAVDFSTYNRFTHKSMTQSSLYGWMEFFEPLRRATWIKDEVESRRAAAAKPPPPPATKVEEKTTTSKPAKKKKVSDVSEAAKERLIVALREVSLKNPKATE